MHLSSFHRSQCLYTVKAFFLAAVLVVATPLMTPARAQYGSYSDPVYTGGKVTHTGTWPPNQGHQDGPYTPSSGSYGGGDGEPVFPNGNPPQSTSAGVNSKGAITTTFTWSGQDPDPTSAIAVETATVSYSAAGSTGGSGSGSAQLDGQMTLTKDRPSQGGDTQQGVYYSALELALFHLVSARRAATPSRGCTTMWWAVRASA